MYVAMRDTSWVFFGDMPWSDGRSSGFSGGEDQELKWECGGVVTNG